MVTARSTKGSTRSRRARPPVGVDGTERRISALQCVGYWFVTAQEVPRTRPAFDPTGGLLLRSPQAGRSAALLLIELDGVWWPLSEAALQIYAHGRALVEERSYVFVESATEQERWPGARYLITGPIKLVSQAVVGQEYGMVAGRRARHDKRTVQVNAERIDVSP